MKTSNTESARPALNGRKVTLTTTVPVWLADDLGEMAEQKLVTKSVLVRQLLLEHVQSKRSEVSGVSE